MVRKSCGKQRAALDLSELALAEGDRREPE